jgi:probable rRNA maturation factor
MANRSQPREGPEPEPQRALVLRNRHRLRRVDLRLLRRIVHALLRETGHDGSFDLAIYLVSAPEITLLNEKFLQHKGSTDVITFDYTEPAGSASRSASFEARARPSVDKGNPSSTPLHGEIFVCLDEAVSQARRFHTTWHGELVRYAVHGVLHLLGYDDQNARVRRKMKKVEDILVRQLATRFEFQHLSD